MSLPQRGLPWPHDVVFTVGYNLFLCLFNYLMFFFLINFTQGVIAGTSTVLGTNVSVHVHEWNKLSQSSLLPFFPPPLCFFPSFVCVCVLLVLLFGFPCLFTSSLSSSFIFFLFILPFFFPEKKITLDGDDDEDNNGSHFFWVCYLPDTVLSILLKLTVLKFPQILWNRYYSNPQFAEVEARSWRGYLAVPGYGASKWRE